MTTSLKRRADQMHGDPDKAKTEVPSESQYYMLHYSKIRTRVTKCGSGEGVKVEMCEPTIKKVVVSLSDADAAVLSCNVGKNVRMFSETWHRLCEQQTLTKWIESKEEALRMHQATVDTAFFLCIVIK